MVAKSEILLVERLKSRNGSSINAKITLNERNIKKKLNKRQRMIKNKLKELHLKRNKNGALTDHSENVDLVSPKTILTKTAIYDIKDPKNYSPNWEKLKYMIQQNNAINPKINNKNSFKEDIKVQSAIYKRNIKNKIFTTSSSENPVMIKSCNSLLNNETLSSKMKIVALDCEMVGGGFNGQDNILARVSIVDHNGSVLYDEHVKPLERVTDYRTSVSGIRPSDLKNDFGRCARYQTTLSSNAAKGYSVVQQEVSDIMDGCIIVGHALCNDFKCLLLSPPRYMIRDTSKFKPFVKLFNGGTPGLKKLTAKVLGLDIQTGEHNSVQDAQAAMRLYMLHRKEFEARYTKRILRGKTKHSKYTKNKNTNLLGIVC